MAVPPPTCVSVIMNGDEKRVTVRNLKPSHIAMMYSLDPDTVWLVDSQNLVCMQSPDRQSFEDVDASQGPFTVLGNPLQSSFVPSLPLMPSISHRPVAPPPFGVVPGARTVGNQPPGLHQVRRQIPTRPISPELLTKTIKITHCERGVRGGLTPSKGMTHIMLTREECNVPSINAKLQSVETFEGYVIADKNGIRISDDPSTRDPSYWHFGRRQAGNAVKYYAIKADLPSRADAESDASDESDDDFQFSRSYTTRGSKRRLSEKKIVDRVAKKMRREAAQTASDREQIAAAAVDTIQSPLRDTLRCGICLAVSKEPTVCKICENLIGCYSCVETGAAENSTCPLHRCNWELYDGLGYMKTRITFDNIPGLYE